MKSYPTRVLDKKICNSYNYYNGNKGYYVINPFHRPQQEYLSISVPIWTPGNPDDYLGGTESCSYFQQRFDYKISDVSCDNDIRWDGHAYPRFGNKPVCEAEF